MPSHGALLGVRVSIAQSWGTVGGASDYCPVMGHCWGGASGQLKEVGGREPDTFRRVRHL